MNIKKRIYYVGLLAFGLMLIVVASPHAQARPLDKDFTMFSENNIIFYDPCPGFGTGSSTSGSGAGAGEGDPSAGLTAARAGWVDKWQSTAVTLSIKYGIPWEAVMAQSILESSENGIPGNSRIARDKNNFFGIGAKDGSAYESAYTYATPEEGWNGYYEFIRSNKRYREHGVFSGDAITNPHVYLEKIKAAGYATDPNYIAKVDSLITAIENRSKEKGWDSSLQLSQKNPEMLTNAARNAAGAGGGSSTGGSDSASGSGAENSDFCPDGDGGGGGGGGAGNGSINDTAIALAWPTKRKQSKEDAEPKYKDAKPEYKAALSSTGIAAYKDYLVSIGASCDAFLATVMRYSGADPNFLCCGSGAQLNYMASHPELYQEIPNLGNTSNMQPGDIRAKVGHVEIYVVVNGEGKIASASRGERTGEIGNYYPGPEYRIFRKI